MPAVLFCRAAAACFLCLLCTLRAAAYLFGIFCTCCIHLYNAFFSPWISKDGARFLHGTRDLVWLEWTFVGWYGFPRACRRRTLPWPGTTRVPRRPLCVKRCSGGAERDLLRSGTMARSAPNAALAASRTLPPRLSFCRLYAALFSLLANACYLLFATYMLYRRKTLPFLRLYSSCCTAFAAACLRCLYVSLPPLLLRRVRALWFSGCATLPRELCLHLQVQHPQGMVHYAGLLRLLPVLNISCCAWARKKAVPLPFA